MFDAASSPAGAGWSKPWLTLRPVATFGAPHGVRSFALKSAWFVFIVAGYLPAAAAYEAVGLPGVVGVAGLWLLCALIVWRAMRVIRIEWDGRVVRLFGLGGQRVIGVAGTGEVVRADLDQGAPFTTPTLMWLDADGKTIGRLIEWQWAGDELDELLRQARIPVTDVGRVTVHELAKQYPSTMPRVLGMPLGVPVWEIGDGPPSDGQARARRMMLLTVVLLVMVAITVLTRTA